MTAERTRPTSRRATRPADGLRDRPPGKLGERRDCDARLAVAHTQKFYSSGTPWIRLNSNGLKALLLGQNIGSGVLDK